MRSDHIAGNANYSQCQIFHYIVRGWTVDIHFEICLDNVHHNWVAKLNSISGSGLFLRSHE